MQQLGWGEEREEKREGEIDMYLKMVQGLYAENCRMLMKEMKDDLNKWRDVSCPQIIRLKYVSSPQLIYRYNGIPIEMPARFFVDKETLF